MLDDGDDNNNKDLPLSAYNAYKKITINALNPQGLIKFRALWREGVGLLERGAYKRRVGGLFEIL